MKARSREKVFGPVAEQAPAKERKKSRVGDRLITILLIFGLLGGVILLLYPTVSDFWNKNHATRAISEYSENVMQMEPSFKKEALEAAMEYNASLASGMTAGNADMSRYEELLRFDMQGMMGYVEIKKINCTLPIYHGTEEEVLQRAIGHLPWSSLPVGASSYDEKKNVLTDPNDGAHCVISGHRGLPSAKLFSDLDQLDVGDLFMLSVLDEVYTYEVDQILTVLPADLTALTIEKGHDYCTLVTCTPYGVNSHRLLVRGHRVPSQYAYLVQPNAVQIKPAIVAALMTAALFLIFFIVAMINPGKIVRKKQEKAGILLARQLADEEADRALLAEIEKTDLSDLQL